MKHPLILKSETNKEDTFFVYNGVTYTYGEMFEHVHKYCLKLVNIKPGLVGVYLDSNLEFITTLLALQILGKEFIIFKKNMTNKELYTEVIENQISVLITKETTHIGYTLPEIMSFNDADVTYTDIPSNGLAFILQTDESEYIPFTFEYLELILRNDNNAPSKYLTTYPMYEIFGLRVLMASLYNSSSFVFSDNFSRTNLVHEINEENVTHIYTNESILEDILSEIKSDVLEICSLGFEKIDRNMINKCFEHKIPIVSMYGLEETFGPITMMDTDELFRNPKGFGEANPEIIMITEINEQGIGYININKRLLSDSLNVDGNDDDIWVKTRDIGYIENDCLHYISKEKDVIEFRGKLFSVDEISRCINKDIKFDIEVIINEFLEKKLKITVEDNLAVEKITVLLSQKAIGLSDIVDFVYYFDVVENESRELIYSDDLGIKIHDFDGNSLSGTFLLKEQYANDLGVINRELIMNVSTVFSKYLSRKILIVGSSINVQKAEHRILQDLNINDEVSVKASVVNLTGDIITVDVKIYRNESELVSYSIIKNILIK